MTRRRLAGVGSDLAAFQAATPVEESDRTRMVDLLDSPEPFSREQYSPGHFTASGFVVPPGRDAFLLVWHQKIGAWLQPGGHFEVGDPEPLAAARREVAEETGMIGLTLARDGLFDVDVHAFPARGDDPEHLHFDLRFLFLAPVRAIAGGSEQWRWVPLTDVLDMDESLARPARKAQATS